MKKQILFGLLAAGMLAACSSDDSLNIENGNNQGDKYMSLAINLPTTPATRAANDNFSDGITEEYSVRNATLVLFEGTSEASATVANAYTLNASTWTAGSVADITTTTQIVQKLKKSPASGNKFYALVILNNQGILTADGDNKLKCGSTDMTGQDFETVNDIISVTTGSVEGKFFTAKTSTSPAKDFFMANSPVADKVGGTSDPSGANLITLVEIDPSKIYETEAEAKANPAATINVERAVAKVSVTAENGKTSVNNLTYTIEGWELNNKNTASYIVRNVDFTDAPWGLKALKTGADSYRFVSGSNGLGNVYRTYWALDPNYTGIGLSDTDKGKGMCYWDQDNQPTTWLKADATTDWTYCAENTFDVAGQNDINTTAVVVKVKFNAGADFYTVNMSDADLYDQDGIDAYIKAQFMTNPTIKSDFKPLIAAGKEVTATDLTIVWDNTDEAGIVPVKEIKVAGAKLATGTDLTITTSDTDPATKDALKIINTSSVVRRYVGGIAYYPILIKHFGDDLTPWHNGEDVADYLPKPGSIYPGASQDDIDAKYLGRYGVVRNNWYDITVSAIKNIGEATVPSLGNEGDPHEDDVLESYISVKINILPWAKRLQNVVL